MRMYRRGLLRYSLRGLLIVVAAICVWLGSLANASHRQRAAVQALEALGGIVRYEFQCDVAHWGTDHVQTRYAPEPSEAAVPQWLVTLVGNDFFYTVKEVVLTRVGCVYRRLGPRTELVTFGPLEEIDVTNQVETAIKHLKELRGLEKVHVEFPHFWNFDREPFAVDRIDSVRLPLLARLKTALPDCDVVFEENVTMRPERKRGR